MHDLSIYGRGETEASALGDKFRPRQTETDRYTYRQRDRHRGRYSEASMTITEK